jgi:DNA repair exonuclease SbcCD ATPase subunit
MPNESDNLNKIEQEAQELVNKLQDLNSQIKSYASAKISLQETSQKIESLIKAMKDLTEKSSTIIAKFDEISGESLLHQLEDIQKKFGILEIALNTNKDNMNRAISTLDELSTSGKKNKRVLAYTFGGIATIIVLLLIKTFVIDGINISEILTRLKGMI